MGAEINPPRRCACVVARPAPAVAGMLGSVGGDLTRCTVRQLPPMCRIWAPAARSRAGSPAAAAGNPHRLHRAPVIVRVPRVRVPRVRVPLAYAPAHYARVGILLLAKISAVCARISPPSCTPPNVRYWTQGGTIPTVRPLCARRSA